MEQHPRSSSPCPWQELRCPWEDRAQDSDPGCHGTWEQLLRCHHLRTQQAAAHGHG